MPRSRQPSMARSIALAAASSRKNSAGPPIPKDVRELSGSCSLIPGSDRSHPMLDLVRQVIAQLLDVAGAHEQDEIVRTDDLLECFARGLEITDVDRLRDLVREVGRLNAGDVVLARAVDIEDVDAIGAGERAREIVHQRVQP